MKALLAIALLSQMLTQAAPVQMILLPGGRMTNEATAFKAAEKLMADESPKIKAGGLDFMTLLAKGGSVNAAFHLGEFYVNTRADEKALDFYLLAARKGHTRAQRSAAVWLVNHGRANDARYWYNQAAAAGDDYSQNAAAGYIYKDGNQAKAFAIWEKNEGFAGLAERVTDPVEKYKWLRVSQMRGLNNHDEAARLKDFIMQHPKTVVDQGEIAAFRYYTNRYKTKPTP